MEYFIIINNVQQGPFSIEELRLRNLSSETLVWAEGMVQWTPAWKVEELKPLFYGNSQSQGPAMPSPPPPFNPTEVSKEQPMNPYGVNSQQQSQVGTNVESKPKSSHRLIWAGVIIIGLLLFMGITNPSKDDHREAIREKITRGITHAVASQNNDDFFQSLSMISHLFAGPLVNMTLDNVLEYNNYVLFSTTSIQTKKGDITTSYGIFGKVFTTSEEKIASMVSSVVDQSGVEHSMNNNTNVDDPTNINAPQDQKDNKTETQSADTTDLGTAISSSIINHVGSKVKRKIKESTDSTTSNSIGELLDKIIQLIKGG